MAVFSDVDITSLLGNGITIENFNPINLGNDSYDLGVIEVWRVTDPQLKDDIFGMHRDFGSRGLNTEYNLHLSKVTKRQRTPNKSGMLNPNDVYIAECDTRITTPSGVRVRVVPKSSRARDGVHAFNPNFDGFAAIVPYTFAKVPEGPVAQAIFYEDPTRPLSKAEMEKLCEIDRLFFSTQRIFSDERDNGFVPMSFDRRLLTYIGGKLTEADSQDKFSTSSRRSIFGFYLGITREEFGTGNSCILWMLSTREGHIYPNAPLVHANVVPPQKHTLEVSLAPEDVQKIQANGKAQYACSVRAYALKTPTTTCYNGKYTAQTQPLPKI